MGFLSEFFIEVEKLSLSFLTASILSSEPRGKIIERLSVASMNFENTKYISLITSRNPENTGCHSQYQSTYPKYSQYLSSTTSCCSQNTLLYYDDLSMAYPNVETSSINEDCVAVSI